MGTDDQHAMNETDQKVRICAAGSKKKARLENQPGSKSLGRGCLKGRETYVRLADFVQVRKEQGLLRKAQLQTLTY